MPRLIAHVSSKADLMLVGGFVGIRIVAVVLERRDPRFEVILAVIILKVVNCLLAYKDGYFSSGTIEVLVKISRRLDPCSYEVLDRQGRIGGKEMLVASIKGAMNGL